MDETTPFPPVTVRHGRLGRPAVCQASDLAAPHTGDSSDDRGSGSTLSVYLPPGTPERVRELLHEQIAGLLSRTRRGFGPQVVWHPGNPLNLPE
ncbi:hypothetical protein [Streptacidiphilus jiangxiensis]|uniref:hypothetical protein n=1 Tax=Streptacidiphilus jiangxiensis TaxID=235985 RepID=UPI000A602E55|nr:hypothetical protein [Streptacidiphilus jiangxiensis]